MAIPRGSLRIRRPVPPLERLPTPRRPDSVRGVEEEPVPRGIALARARRTSPVRQLERARVSARIVFHVDAPPTFADTIRRASAKAPFRSFYRVGLALWSNGYASVRIAVAGIVAPFSRGTFFIQEASNSQTTRLVKRLQGATNHWAGTLRSFPWLVVGRFTFHRTDTRVLRVLLTYNIRPRVAVRITRRSRLILRITCIVCGGIPIASIAVVVAVVILVTCERQEAQTSETSYPRYGNHPAFPHHMHFPIVVWKRMHGNKRFWVTHEPAMRGDS